MISGLGKGVRAGKSQFDAKKYQKDNGKRSSIFR